MINKKTILAITCLLLFALSSCFSGGADEPIPTIIPTVEEPTAVPEVVIEPTQEPEEVSQNDQAVEPGFATNPSGTFIITINEDGSKLIEVPDSGFMIEFSADYEAIDPADNEQIQDAIQSSIEESLFSNQIMAQLAASGIKLYAVNLSNESLTNTNPGTINIIRQELPIEVTLEQLIQANNAQLGSILDLTSDISTSETTLGDQPAAIMSYTANISNGSGQIVEQLNNQYFVMDPEDAMVAYIITAASPNDSDDALVEDLKRTAETFRLLEN